MSEKLKCKNEEAISCPLILIGIEYETWANL